MGSSMSHNHNHNDNNNNQQHIAFQTLSALLREDPVPWNDVRQSLRENPEQACMYAHGIEDSQLFVAITKRGCPPDIIKTMIEADEDAFDYTSSENGGQTVLHAAVTAAVLPQDDGVAEGPATDDAEIVRLLLSQPNGRLLVRTTNREGMLPIHLCRSKAVAKVLLRAYPGSCFHRSHYSGSLPLHHVLMDGDSVNPDLCDYIVQQTLNTQSRSTSSSSICCVPPVGGILTRNKHGKTPLSLLLEHMDDDMIAITNRNKLWSILRDTFLPVLMSSATITRGLELHTLVDYRCLHSERLMEMALKVYSHQASLRDELGRTPLHVAVADTGTCRCSYEALQCLIRANPKAPRMGDNDGRLPIDWAAECPHISNRNLALLMKGEPRAIDTRDLQYGRYPFVSAALKEHNNSINNTYTLLRAKPHVLSYFHTP